jgi:hypothetical protein
MCPDSVELKRLVDLVSICSWKGSEKKAVSSPATAPPQSCTL